MVKLSFNKMQYAGKYQAKPGHKSNQKHSNQDKNQIGEYFMRNTLNAGLANGTTDIGTHADRRQESSDSIANNHYYAILHRVDAKLGSKWQQKRAENNESGQSFKDSSRCY